LETNNDSYSYKVNYSGCNVNNTLINTIYHFSGSNTSEITTSIPVKISTDFIPELSLYTAQTIAAKFQENQKINLDKLLLPLSYNIAKDCLLRAENNNPTLLRAYPTVNAEAERFATTERAYRRVVTELVEKGLVKRSNQGLQVVDMNVNSFRSMKVVNMNLNSLRCVKVGT